MRRSVVGGAMLLASCGAPPEPDHARPLPSAPAPVSAPASADAAIAPPSIAEIDATTYAPLLSDPRLAEALREKGEPAKAADALSGVIASVKLDDGDLARYRFLLGRFRRAAGDEARAVEAFRGAAERDWPLRAHAHVEAARSLAKLGKASEVLAELAVTRDLPRTLTRDALALEVDALLATNAIDQAKTKLVELIEKESDPDRWAPRALALAKALLEAPDEGHAVAAFGVAQTVELDAGGSSAKEALKLEATALGKLSRERRATLEQEQSTVDRASRLMASREPARALVELASAKKDDDACALKMLRGQALALLHREREAATTLDGALKACASLAAQRPRILAFLADALEATGRHREASEKYAELEKDLRKGFGASRARLDGARAALAGGDVERFRLALGTIDEDFGGADPSVADGMFELALQRIDEGDWAGAIPTLEAGARRTKTERSRLYAGRFGYFLALAHLAKGDADKAYAELERVVLGNPLSYWMVLASARLAAKDPARFDRLLRGALVADAAETFSVPRGDWADAPEFLRAVELARLGDAIGTERELRALGVGSGEVVSDVLYAAAFLYRVAGSPERAAGVLRSGAARHAGLEATEYLDHYPAGRWKTPWEIAFPRFEREAVEAAARTHGLAPALAFAVARETREASGSARVDLVARLADLERNLGGDLPLVLAAERSGARAAKSWSKRRARGLDLWLEHLDDASARGFVKSALSSVAAYELVYAAGEPSAALHLALATSAVDSREKKPKK